MDIIFALIAFLRGNQMCNFQDFVNQVGNNEMIKNKKVFLGKMARTYIQT